MVSTSAGWELLDDKVSFSLMLTKLEMKRKWHLLNSLSEGKHPQSK